MRRVFAIALCGCALGCGAGSAPEPAVGSSEPIPAAGAEVSPEAAAPRTTPPEAPADAPGSGSIGGGPASDIAVPRPSGPVPGRGGSLDDLNAELAEFVRRSILPGAPEPDAAIDWRRQARIVDATAISVGGSGARPADQRHGFPPRVPEGCEPGFATGGGYEALAMPPPMDDLEPADARRVEEAIRYLLEGQELYALCLYEVYEYDSGADEPRLVVRPRPAYVLNVYHDRRGYHVQAFAQLDGAETGTYPEP